MLWGALAALFVALLLIFVVGLGALSGDRSTGAWCGP